jgi:hypothetical protein
VTGAVVDKILVWLLNNSHTPVVPPEQQPWGHDVALQPH